jgi:hypothetical protein
MRRSAGTGDDSPARLLIHLPAWITFAWDSDCCSVDCRPGHQHGFVMRQGAHGGWDAPLSEEIVDALTSIGPSR